MVARIVNAAVALAAVGLLALGWENLGLLWGTPLWDVRHVVFVAGGFLVLSLFERVASALSRRLAPHGG